MEEQKNKTNISSWSFILAAGVVVYVFLVSLIMRYTEKVFGPTNTLWNPIAFLMLFVLSASVVGLLIFARPLMLYLDGNKKEGIKMLILIIGWLLLLTLSFFLLRLVI